MKHVLVLLSLSLSLGAQSTGAQSTGVSPAVGRGRPPFIGTDVMSQGVACDGSTDDTAALNTMFTKAPDWSAIIWPAGCQMKITNTINIHGKQGLRLIGLASPGTAATTGQNNPTFLWWGSEGGRW